MFLALMIFWLVFNGRVTVEILAVGCVCSAAVTYMAKAMFGMKGNLICLSPSWMWRYFKYFVGLVIEIISCSIKVMHLVYHPQEEVRPQLLTFRVPIKNDGHKVLLANSITLTPGTITVGLLGDRMRVHGLDGQFIDGIEDCDMVRRLEKIESGEKK